MTDRQKFASVDEYLSSFDGETRKRLDTVRELVKELAPESTERISYNIPAAFIGKTTVIYYSGYPHHVSIYPGRIATEALDDRLKPYFSGKSTLKFPNDTKLPIDSIKDYIAARAEIARH